MKYVCLFVSEVTHIFTEPHARPKISKSTESLWDKKTVFCISTQQREHQQFKFFPVSLQCGSKITFEKCLDEWKHSLDLQPFKSLAASYSPPPFFIFIIILLEESYTVFRGLKPSSSFNQINSKLFQQIHEIKVLNVHTYILLWPLHSKQISHC